MNPVFATDYPSPPRKRRVQGATTVALPTLDSRFRAGLSGERVNELWLHAKRHLGLVVSFWLKRLRKECLACATKIRCSAVC